jgi:hypothetical protein
MEKRKVGRPKKQVEVFEVPRTAMVQATSRVSAKIKESFYTFEFSEQLVFDSNKNYNLEQEKEDLWNRVHEQVDKQLDEIFSMQK